MKHQTLIKPIIILGDLFAIALSAGLALWMRRWCADIGCLSLKIYLPNDPIFFGILYFSLLLFLYLQGLYTRRYDFWEEMRRIMQAILLTSLLIIFYLFFTKSSAKFSRFILAMTFINMIWILPMFRWWLKRRLFAMGWWQIPVFVTGNLQQAREIKDKLLKNRYLGYVPIEHSEGSRVVFIATRGLAVESLEEMFHRYRQEHREIVIVPYLEKISYANAEIVDLWMGRMSLLVIQNRLLIPRSIFLKRFVETALVLMILPIFLPLFGLIALAIRLDSPGGALFRQKRLGREGVPFECYKFRTMRIDGEEILQRYLQENPQERLYYELYHKYRFDPRITRVGRWLRKTSLDELPQILNILKGEMTLVGPRPYMLSEREKMGEAAEVILQVSPGITGLWQVMGRNELTFADRLELDVWYIRNWSLWLDFIIFIKTFYVLFSRQGAR